MQFTGLSQAKSVLHQVACALAVGEATLQFEHRDLHWGNILVRPTSEESIDYMLDGEIISIASCGVRVALIDFTLSRLSKGQKVKSPLVFLLYKH